MSARRSERVLNLLIALLVSRGWVTKERLRQVIPDYAEAPSEAAFERMFDRDKEELRALGVPVEMGGHDAYFDDEYGYRVVRSAFELPEISLTADEAAVVGLAARVWQHAGLAAATSDALLKLEAAGVEVDREALDLVQPRLAADEPSFETFWEALATRRPVRFSYRAGGAATPSVRRFEPWGIVSYRSRWYAVGHDRDRDDQRMFRLSRVAGAVEYDGPPGSFTVPDGVDVRALASRLAPDTPGRTAVMLVRAGRAHALRHRATSVTADRPGWERLVLGFGRSDGLVDEVLAHGSDVVVLEPEDVRAGVVARLRAVAG